jgi:hypothetical protein
MGKTRGAQNFYRLRRRIRHCVHAAEHSRRLCRTDGWIRRVKITRTVCGLTGTIIRARNRRPARGRRTIGRENGEQDEYNVYCDEGNEMIYPSGTQYYTLGISLLLLQPLRDCSSIPLFRVIA